MIKIILLFGVIIGCAYLGKLFSKSGEIRVLVLNDFLHDLCLFKNLVMLERRDVISALKKMGNQNGCFFCDLYIDIIKKIEKAPNIDITACWHQISADSKNENGREYLKEKDHDKINDFGGILTSFRHAVSADVIDRHIGDLSDYIDMQQKEQTKKTKIYNKLGLIIGLFLGIILI